MAVITDTFVKRIPLAPMVDLDERIKAECEIQSGRDQPRRLAAAFEAQNQLVLIFQQCLD
jgi:hypothetical protein